MQKLKTVLTLAALVVALTLLGGCCGGANPCRWWDPCNGPDCCPVGDPCDCCDPCGC